MRLIAPLLALLLLSACAVRPPESDKGAIVKRPVTLEPAVRPGLPLRLQGRAAVRDFIAVINRVEPVAEEVCRAQAPQLNCDFLIVVDDAVNAPPNAYQKVDGTGRPIIAFTVPLLGAAQNQDELAFILSHEAAHHIAGHLQRQQVAAQIGAAILGNLAGLSNDAGAVRNAQQLGAVLGARTYSKEFELEADALGARIAGLAGYDPLRGAAFFFRIPDPGDTFLGTHPANADRFRTVQRVTLGL